jgi:hypothetical protein
MYPASTSSSISTRLRFFLGVVFAGACCVSFAILFHHVSKSFQPRPMPLSESDPIIDIWINKMLGYFIVFLPDNTVRLYESYSFELDSVGRWRKVEDRTIYPESPKVRLHSYKVEFEHDRVMDVFIYPIAHHYSIVIEDRMIGHRGYNRLSDVDDPNGFYHHKFTQGLPQELSIVNSYWKGYKGRPYPREDAGCNSERNTPN